MTDPRKLDRFEAPNYLAKYRERQGVAPATNGSSNGGAATTVDDTPLYLRRFR